MLSRGGIGGCVFSCDVHREFPNFSFDHWNLGSDSRKRKVGHLLKSEGFFSRSLEFSVLDLENDYRSSAPQRSRLMGLCVNKGSCVTLPFTLGTDELGSCWGLFMLSK